MAAPSSAIDRAPSNDTAPPTSHTRMTGADACRFKAMTLGTMKMAEAMIVPRLIIVESSNPSWRLSSASAISAHARRDTRT